MNYKLINFCEINVFASKAYELIHKVNNELNLGDITKVDVSSLPTNVGIITHGSPCQSFSLAGKQEGGDKNSGTKSSLLWNSVEIITHCRPKVVIWENVKNVLAPKHKHNFDAYISEMNNLGYNSHYEVLNGVDYGVPQKRERVFVVSIRNDVGIGFKFPNKIPLKFMLEDVVDFRECDDITFNFKRRYEEVFNQKISDEYFVNYIESLPITKGIGGKKMNLYSFGEMDTITTSTGVTGTLTCRNVQNYNKKYWYKNRLYKPSPRMVWRLMDFTDQDYEMISDKIPENEAYNCGGNSIIVNVVYEIFKELYLQHPSVFKDLTLISLFSGIGAFEKGLDRLYEHIDSNK